MTPTIRRALTVIVMPTTIPKAIPIQQDIVRQLQYPVDENGLIVLNETADGTGENTGTKQQDEAQAKNKEKRAWFRNKVFRVPIDEFLPTVVNPHQCP